MKNLMLSTTLIAMAGFAGVALADATAVTGSTSVDAGAAADAMKTDLSVQTDAAAGVTVDAQTGTAAMTTPTAHVPVVRDGFEATDMTAITSDVLIGAKAYDSNDVSVGEVSELVMDADKKVTDLVVDVGGFLGIGEKPVALKLADVDILRASGGGEVRVYVALTKDQLEALPTYAK